MDIKLLTFMNQSPIFKGVSLTILGVLAILFGLWMKKKNKKMDFNLWVYIIISVAILIYGIFVLIYRPVLWMPPQ